MVSLFRYPQGVWVDIVTGGGGIKSPLGMPLCQIGVPVFKSRLCSRTSFLLMLPGRQQKMGQCLRLCECSWVYRLARSKHSHHVHSDGLNHWCRFIWEEQHTVVRSVLIILKEVEGEWSNHWRRLTWCKWAAQICGEIEREGTDSMQSRTRGL